MNQESGLCLTLLVKSGTAWVSPAPSITPGTKQVFGKSLARWTNNWKTWICSAAGPASQNPNAPTTIHSLEAPLAFSDSHLYNSELHDDGKTELQTGQSAGRSRGHCGSTALILTFPTQHHVASLVWPSCPLERRGPAPSAFDPSEDLTRTPSPVQPHPTSVFTNPAVHVMPGQALWRRADVIRHGPWCQELRLYFGKLCIIRYYFYKCLLSIHAKHCCKCYRDLMLTKAKSPAALTTLTF